MCVEPKSHVSYMMKTHVAQQPNGYGPYGIEEVNKREKETKIWCLLVFFSENTKNVPSPTFHHKRENRKAVSSSIALEEPHFFKINNGFKFFLI